MSFIDKYYKKFNDSVGEHSLTISRVEFANLLGVFSKHEQQLDQLKAENDELRQILWNVDFNRQSKGRKLIRIEELLKKCSTGYTDEFIQEMFSILYELEPVCRYNKLEKYFQTLTEIKEICNNNDELKGDFNLVDCDKYKLGKHNLANKILQKISEVIDD